MQTLLVIFRSIFKGKFYSFVSVMGLAVSLATVILVAALIRQETSFEDVYSKANDIYRLTWENQATGDKFATMFNPFSPQMVIDFPEVIDAARVGTSNLLFERQGQEGQPSFKSFEDMAFVDAAFFNLFDLKFVEGDPKTVLADPTALVLTQAAAQKYFGDESPMGKTLTVENEVPLTVRGVLEDMPDTTHFSFHFVVNLELMRTLYGGAGFLDNWGSDRLYHYVLIEPGADVEDIQSQLPDFARRHSGFDDFDFGIYLQPLKDIHFTNNLQDDVPFQDSIKNTVKAPRKMEDLVLFSAGAFILVLVASFNFMNLQVARSVGKNRQMGLFKVFGATRKKITRFILQETLVLSFVGLLFSLLLVDFSLDWFSALLGTSLSWSEIFTFEIIALMVLVTCSVALISGAYPALLIGSQAPTKIFRGEFKLGQGAEKARQSLVFLQFAFSVVLIVVSFGIYSQINYSLSQPLGFDDEGTVILDGNRSEVRGVYDTLRARLIEHPDIEYVSRASIVPPGNLSDGFSFVPEGGDPNNPVGIRLVLVDFDYFEALGIDVLAGRPFLRNFPADEASFPTPENPSVRNGLILNEAAARNSGWLNPDEALNKATTTQYSLGDVQATINMNVVGVVPDIHFRSLRSEISPMAFLLFPNAGGHIIVKISNSDPKAASDYIAKIWNDLVPTLPFSPAWLSQSVDQLYAQERKTLSLLSGISVITIFIAALGLFAVATLVMEKRTKEVGLRKVLGAKVRQIVNLVSWQFLKPVLLANLLAWPVAWYFLDDWLKAFVMRFDLSVMNFLIPTAIAIFVAWGTVAGKAWKVARANPVKALRYE